MSAAAILDPLRRAAWLTAARARLYGAGMLAICLALTTAFYVQTLRPAFTDPAGRPMGYDFDAFWSGATLALHGHPAAAYDGPAMKAAESVGAQLNGEGWYIYLYPPMFQLFSLPLGLLPYGASLAVFLVATAAAMATALRRILPPAWPWLTIAALPVAWGNAMVGQNGFATAACFAAAMITLERRPALSGACLGLLAAKPHLALCVPLGLLAARRWRALATCAATALGAGLLSWVVLGTQDWRAFLAQLPMTKMMLGSPAIWPKLASVFAAVKILHGGETAAWLAQAAAALAAGACVLRVCARRPGAGPEIATIAAAALLCTPYAWDYDLMVLAVPLAWAAGQASLSGWRPWERAGLATIYVLSAVTRPLNQDAGLPLAPLLLAGLLALVAARALPPHAASVAA